VWKKNTVPAENLRASPAKRTGCVNLNGRGSGTVCAKSKNWTLSLWKWLKQLTYIGPLNQKYFGIKHQPGHIISAASSSRLVGPSLLASYISDRHLFQVNRTHQHVRFQDTYTLHRSKRWYQKIPASTVNCKQNWNLEWFRGYIRSRSLWCVDCWPVNQIVNCMIGRTGSYRFGSSTE